MAPPQRNRPLTRADLPAELTAQTLRRVDFRTLRRFAHRDNGVLDAEEQKQFDHAFAEMVRGTASRVNESLERASRGGPGNLDPAMRRSYQRTQQRLAEQADRLRERFPEIAPDKAPDTAPDKALDAAPEETPSVDESRDDDHLSPGTLEQEVEQTSETLDLLERIATLQQHQLEHQESQLLSETRGYFFAFTVSVAVIIAGVAPLVDAEPHDRLLILVWTAVTVVAAGVVYALVRWVQGRRR